MVRSRTRKLRPKTPMFPFAPKITAQNDDLLEPAEDEEHPTSLPVSPKEQETMIERETKPVIETVTVNPVVSKPPTESEAPKIMTHHDSICFLKIIGSIQSGQKLSHASNHPNQPFSIDANQWSSSISRWWNGDSRTMTIKLLREKFDGVFKNIDDAYSRHTQRNELVKKEAFNRSPKDTLLDYARELSGAEKGLRHLCHTYKKDIPITSELQVMLESVQIRKQTIDNMFTIKED